LYAQHSFFNKIRAAFKKNKVHNKTLKHFTNVRRTEAETCVKTKKLNQLCKYLLSVKTFLKA